MTVSETRTLIHESKTAVNVDVIIDQVLEKFEPHEKRLLMEVLVEDRAITVAANALSLFSQKLKNVVFAIALLQSYGVKI